jgi:hypothetical protein
MSTAPPLEIKVVYDSSTGPSRRGRVLPGRRQRRRGSSLLVGLLSLLVAGGMCYVTWWPVDKFIYVYGVLRTPFEIPGVEDPDEAVGNLFPGLASNPSGSSSVDDVLEDSSPPPAIAGRTAQMVIGITAGSWYVLTTIACCALGLAGGTAFGRSGSTWRTIGLILSVGLVLVLGWRGYGVWTEYGREYPPDALRAGMAGLVLLSVLIGVAIGRATRGFSRFAAIMVIVAAVGSVVGLYLGHLCGVIDPDKASIFFLVIVFVVHSLWGWVLLFVAPRAAR